MKSINICLNIDSIDVPALMVVPVEIAPTLEAKTVLILCSKRDSSAELLASIFPNEPVEKKLLLIFPLAVICPLNV